MRASFVRTVGARDRVYVVRDDGSEAAWVFPSYGDELPHDLVHFVCESLFGVKGGIWGHVAAGADLRRINEQAERLGGKDKYAAFGPDLGEVYLAEAIANAPWTRFEEAPDGAALVERIQASGVPLPARVTAATAEEVRARLLALRLRWRQLKPKGAIELDWPLR